MKFYTKSISLLTIVTFLFFNCIGTVSASTSKTISVDFNSITGPMKPKTGWLLTPNSDVPDGRIAPLKTQIVRDDADTQNLVGFNTFNTSDIFAEEYDRLARMKTAYNRLNALNIPYYPVLAYMPSWLSTNGTTRSYPNDYALWKQWVKDNVQYAKDNNMNIASWDVWNEYIGLTDTQYNDMYKQAWDAIKEVMPNAKVVGPSNGGFDQNSLQNFINNVSSNGQTIDRAAWHEFYAPTNIQTDINALKSYAATKPGIGIKQYYMEEYLPSDSTNSAGDLANWFVNLEDANAEVGIKSIWTYPNGLSDLLVTDNTASNIAARKIVWWAMKAYAELAGSKVKVTQAGNGTMAIAAMDPAAGEAKILIGNKGTDSVALTLNLNNQPFSGQNIRIDKYQVTSTENDGLILQSTETPSSTTNLSTSVTMSPDDVWLVVIKKTASAPGSFVLKTPDDQGVATTTPSLTWQAASGATSYNVKVSANKDMSSPIVNVTNVIGTSYPLTTTLTNGTMYYWTVTAVNSNGTANAANSMQYSFTASTSLTIPGGFTMLLVPDGAVGTPTKPKFTWTQSANDSSYTLVVANNSNFTSPVVNQTGITGTNYTLTTDLSNDTTYYAKLISVNASGSRDMNGSVHSFRTIPAGSVPSSFNLSSPVNGATNFSKRGHLSWSNSNGGFFYKLEISTNPSFSNIVLSRDKITTTSYTLEPNILSANTLYYWRVTAYSKDLSVSTLATNNGLSFTTENKPTSPLLKDIDSGDSSVTLFFNSVNDATNYKVKYGTSPGVYTNVISNVSGNSYKVNSLSNGTTYYFAVVANNSNGESDVFNEISAVPLQQSINYKLEAENATLSGAAGLYTDSAASNGLAVGYMGNTGDSITFANVPAGNQVTIHYATLNNGTFSLYQNGTKVSALSFTSTGAWQSNGAYADKIVSLNIASGDTLKLQRDSGDTAINVDYINITPLTTVMEAENATLSGAAGVYTDLAASNGLAVGYMAYTGDAITFANVPAGSQVTIHYATLNNGTFSLYQNGTKVSGLSFTSTGAWQGNGAYANKIVSLNIASGDTLKLQRDSGDTAINVDYINVTATTTNIEAENGTMTGGAGVYTDSSASGGSGVGYMGNVGDAVTLNSVTSGSNVKVRYATMNNGTFSLYKNGVKVTAASFTSTGSWSGATAYADKIIPVTVAAGDTLKFQNDSGDVAINIDYITVN